MRRVLIPHEIAPAFRLPSSRQAIAHLAGETMGTTWAVKWVAREPGATHKIRHGIEALLDRIIAQMSPWVARSDISTFNHAPAGTWHELPAEFLAVLRRALAVARDTGGAYDPTIGALVDAWGFGPAGPCDHAPDAATIAAARSCAGWARLTLDGSRVRQPGGLRLDLSSIAKGYAVDRIAEHLLVRGIAHHLVEVGGELRGSGIKPDGSPWWVALETPGGASDCVVALHNLAVATSGDSQRVLERDGRRWSHTIDPRTGSPAPHRLASVTVLHARCIEADALATALLVLGPEQGEEFAAANGIAARFLLRDGDAMRERLTPAFGAMLA